MKYRAIAKHDLAGDGKVFKAGQPVAMIETTMPVGNMVSGLYFGDLQLVADGSPTGDELKQVRRDPPPSIAPSTEPQPVGVDSDPDALNAADAAADDAPQAQATPEVLQDPISTLPLELQALPPRIASALADHEFTTRADVQAYLESGGSLADVEGIGKAAERKIMEWLKS
jgi:hypothetical protein